MEKIEPIIEIQEILVIMNPCHLMEAVLVKLVPGIVIAAIEKQDIRKTVTGGLPHGKNQVDGAKRTL